MENLPLTLPHPTFAAYVPVCTSCFTAKPTSTSSTGTPWQTDAPHFRQQDWVASGIIMAVCLAGFLFLAITDRR